MTHDEAYSTGYDAGYNAGQYCEVTGTDRRAAGCGCDEESAQFSCEDCITSAAFDSEQNARQYSPFEFTAYAINSEDDAEELWDSYDKGVSDGIVEAVRERLCIVSK